MKKVYRILSMLIISIMLVNICACSIEYKETPAAPPPASAQAENLMKNIKAENTDKLSADENFINAQMDFSVKLFKESINDILNAEEKIPTTSSSDIALSNTLVSPLSVSLSLSMAANGADGKTLKEMENVLGGGMSIDMLNKYLSAYAESFYTDDKNKVKIANSIWYENSFNVNKNFLQTNANYYNSDVYKQNFNNSKTADMINNWVKDNTDNMIDKIVDKVDSDDVMYLINALVFEAEWEDIYEDISVKDDYFTNLYGERKSVEMMHSGESKYISDDKSEGFIKDYKGGKYSFAAILPRYDITIVEYINSLDGKALLNTIKNSEDALVEASMPKFSYDCEFILNDTLKSLGMQDAFKELQADFSKMGTSDLGNVFIGKVLHKTHIEVAEKGTKAGAVTAVVTDGAAAAEEQEVKEVILNRPFVYMIIDNQTNLPVFMGIVTDIEAD